MTRYVLTVAIGFAAACSYASVTDFEYASEDELPQVVSGGIAQHFTSEAYRRAADKGGGSVIGAPAAARFVELTMQFLSYLPSLPLGDPKNQPLLRPGHDRKVEVTSVREPTLICFSGDEDSAVLASLRNDSFRFVGNDIDGYDPGKNWIQLVERSDPLRVVYADSDCTESTCVDEGKEAVPEPNLAGMGQWCFAADAHSDTELEALLTSYKQLQSKGLNLWVHAGEGLFVHLSDDSLRAYGGSTYIDAAKVIHTLHRPENDVNMTGNTRNQAYLFDNSEMVMKVPVSALERYINTGKTPSGAELIHISKLRPAGAAGQKGLLHRAWPGAVSSLTVAAPLAAWFMSQGYYGMGAVALAAIPAAGTALSVNAPLVLNQTVVDNSYRALLPVRVLGALAGRAVAPAGRMLASTGENLAGLSDGSLPVTPYNVLTSVPAVLLVPLTYRMLNCVTCGAAGTMAWVGLGTAVGISVIAGAATIYLYQVAPESAWHTYINAEGDKYGLF